jgi:hypothetical protein
MARHCCSAITLVSAAGVSPATVAGVLVVGPDRAKSAPIVDRSSTSIAVSFAVMGGEFSITAPGDYWITADNAVDDLLRIRTDACEGHAEYHFLAITRDRAEAQRRRLLDGCNITQIHRIAIAHFQDDLAEFLFILCKTETTDQVLFLAKIDVLAAYLRVVRVDRIHHLAEREVVLDQLERFDNGLVLALLTAP